MIALRMEETSAATRRAYDHEECLVIRIRAASNREGLIFLCCWDHGIVLEHRQGVHGQSAGGCPGCGALVVRRTGPGRPQVYCTTACGERHRRALARFSVDDLVRLTDVPTLPRRRQASNRERREGGEHLAG